MMHYFFVAITIFTLGHGKPSKTVEHFSSKPEFAMSGDCQEALKQYMAGRVLRDKLAKHGKAQRKVFIDGECRAASHVSA